MKQQRTIINTAGRWGRWLCVAVGLGMLWPAGQALAVQGFGISPTQQEVALAPGGSTRGQLTVINDGDTNVTYHVYATDYGVRGEDYEGVFGGNSQNSAAGWFGVPSGNLTIAARQESTFNYTLTVPANAAVGGHYAAVFVQTAPQTKPGAAVINRIDRIGSLFYITVKGALDQRGNILPFGVPWLQSTPPIQASVRLQNTGNVHFLVQGTARLSGMFGNKVGNGVQWRGEVLPGTTRRFKLSLPEPQPLGVFKVTTNVTYLGHTVRQAHWVLLVPRITFIIVSATILLLLVGGLWALMRRVRRSQ